MAHLETEILEDRLLLSVAPLPDDFGDTFNDAAEVSFPPRGPGRIKAALQHDGDADMFRFTAGHTGRMLIEDHALAEANFVSFVELFDDEELPILPERFYRNGKHSILSFSVLLGRTYFVKAQAAPASSPPGSVSEDFPFLPSDTPLGQGDFSLYFGPEDDAGNTAFDATPLAGPQGYLAGRIEVPSDVDRFSYVAQQSGRLRVQVASARSNTGPMVLLDAAENVVVPATSPDADNPLEFDVIAGGLYYLEVRGPEIWPAEGWPEYELAYLLLPTTPIMNGPPGSTNGGGLLDGGSDDPGTLDTPQDFLSFMALNRFLDGGESAVPSAEVLPLSDSSGLGLVGTLLGGKSDGTMSMIPSAYFGGGSGNYGEETLTAPIELSGDVVQMNYKMGINEALANEVSGVKKHLLEQNPDAPPTESLSDSLTDLQRFLSEELLRVSRPLREAALSLFQQMAISGQTWISTDALDKPVHETDANMDAGSPATPMPSEEKTKRDPRTVIRAILALVLGLSTAQLWWTHNGRKKSTIPV